MDDILLEKIEKANEWLGLRRGQKANIVTMLNNWAICGEILDQIIGEEYERREDMDKCLVCGKEATTSGRNGCGHEVKNG